MKKARKLLAVVLALMVALTMGIATSSVIFAADGNTISVSGAQNGEKYNIYKMLDLSVNDANNPTSYRYTLNDTWSSFWTSGAGKDYIETNTSGSETYVVWKDDKKTAADMEAFGKAAAAFAKANNISPTKAEVTAANGQAQWTGLDNGYYLVTSTYGTAASVASTPANPVQTISEKNSGNSSDKEVQENAERNGTAKSWPADKANDAAIGDTIQFRSKVSIAKNTTSLVYHDTMTSGLTWDGVSATKVYSDADLTTEIAASNYTVAEGTNGETFTVTFAPDYLGSLTAASTDVYIGYTAVLNDNAAVATDQTNTGKVTWGNNGQGTPTTTTTKTHKFQILKYDGADANKNPLAGAKFQLFTASTGGEALQVAVNSDGTIYRLVKDSTALPEGYTLVSDKKIVTLATGNITIEGVDSDDYYLEETDEPKGYTKLTDRVKVEVNANNELIKEIENNSGATLPSTGGIGTTIFYILGALLVIGCGIVLIARRRLTAK